MLKNLNLSNFISHHITERPESLLAPDFQKFDAELRSRAAGKSVLIIGGAGTIGASFVRAILRYPIGRLFVVDINENGLTELVRDLRSSVGLHIPKDFITYPVNFGDPVFEKIFRNEGPFEIVANFAAHKHVRSEKDHYSIEAMVDNNVLKAKKLLDLLLEFPPEHFFCVSTDKAANPVNVMGASKKLMEEVILAYSERIPISTARFANVAFSNGSLPAGFLERLMRRQPLSSPSDVRRFFVSPQESGEICLMACLMGASGDIFFPKLDPEKDMKTFSFIAEKLLAELGYEPDFCKTEEEARQKAVVFEDSDKKYPVQFFISDTSGEKQFEEFYTGNEVLDLDSFPNLGVIKNAERKTMDELEPIFKKLQRVFRKKSARKDDIVKVMKQILPGFQHIETGKSLDNKM